MYFPALLTQVAEGSPAEMLAAFLLLRSSWWEPESNLDCWACALSQGKASFCDVKPPTPGVVKGNQKVLLLGPKELLGTAFPKVLWNTFPVKSFVEKRVCA